MMRYFTFAHAHSLTQMKTLEWFLIEHRQHGMPNWIELHSKIYLCVRRHFKGLYANSRTGISTIQCTVAHSNREIDRALSSNFIPWNGTGMYDYVIPAGTHRTVSTRHCTLSLREKKCVVERGWNLIIDKRGMTQPLTWPFVNGRRAIRAYTDRITYDMIKWRKRINGQMR